jgi:aspartyl protease family protein
MKLRSLAALLAFAPALCAAIDITVIGLFRDKAVITVNRGTPKTFSVGDRIAEGATLVAVDSKGATVEIDGKRQLLEMGQHFATAAAAAGDRQSVTLPVMQGGHYEVDGTINGGYIRFLVDTGATVVSISRGEAERIGIPYTKGRPGRSQVADGRTIVTYSLMFDSVTVGDITLFNVEGSVRDAAGPNLLGNSFLSRMEMRREGQSLTLTKRY